MMNIDVMNKDFVIKFVENKERNKVYTHFQKTMDLLIKKFRRFSYIFTSERYNM